MLGLVLGLAVLPLATANSQTESASFSRAQDTHIVSLEPDENFGGSATLSGGPDRTILIRFPEISTLNGNRVKVKSATLRLSIVAGDKPEFRQIGALKTPWSEGPLRTFIKNFQAKPAVPLGTKQLAPLNAATWRDRFGQRAGWQRPGAQGNNDAVEIPNLQVTSSESEVLISGLGATVQNWISSPEQNFGIALKLANKFEFASAQSTIGQPTLIVEFESAPSATGPDLAIDSVESAGDSLNVTVTNLGTEAAKFSLSANGDERTGSEIASASPLAPGKTETIKVSKPSLSKLADDFAKPIRIQLATEGTDANLEDNRWTYYDGAPSVRVAPEQWSQLKKTAGLFNELLVPMSRYSWCPAGIAARVNPSKAPEATLLPDSSIKSIALSLGAPDFGPTNFSQSKPPFSTSSRGAGDLAPGLTGYGDTRFDGSLPGTLTIPYEPSSSPIFDVTPLSVQSLLPATDIAFIDAKQRGKTVELPKTTIVRVLDLVGRPISGADYAVLNPSTGDPLAQGKTGTGSVVLPPTSASEPAGMRLLRVTKNGVSDDFWIKTWQLIDTAARGNQAVAFLEARLNLPDLPIEQTDLAKGKSISNSENDPPAKLVSLVGTGAASGVTFSGKDRAWIEIDLGRDRTIAEISLFSNGDFWKSFQILGYGTGQRVDEASPFAIEADFKWAFANRKDADGAVRYRGPAPRVRFIRIINRGKSEGRLNRIEIKPAQIPG